MSNIDRPIRFVRLPLALLRTSIYAPRTIAVYALIARLWLLSSEAVPLSAADLVRYDPSLSDGAAGRALAWLVAHGWLVAHSNRGAKTHYTPTWGWVRGTPLIWQRGDVRLGRPRHVHAVALDVRLLDLYLGRLIPYAGQRPALITRYLTTPALSLADVGHYALLLAGLGVASTALGRLGLATCSAPRPLPTDDAAILHTLGQTTDPNTPMLSERGLSRLEHAVTKANVEGTLMSPSSTGHITVNLSGHLIGHTPYPELPSSPVTPAKAPLTPAPKAILWKKQENTRRIPHLLVGGGRSGPVPSLAEPLTPSAARLRTYQVTPQQARRFADLPLPVVEHVIQAAEARPELRSRPGFVVWALGAYCADGYLVELPAAREVVDWGAVAAQHPGAMTRGDAPEDASNTDTPDGLSDSAGSSTPIAAEARLSTTATDAHSGSAALAALWTDVQTELRLRLGRAALPGGSGALTLHSLEGGIASLIATDRRVKTAIEPHLSLVQLLLAEHGGPLRVHLRLGGRADRSPHPASQ